MQNQWKRPALGIAGIAIAILVVYCIVVYVGTRQTDRQVVVSQEQQETLFQGFERSWQRAPTDKEKDDLLSEHVRREIAYREATRLELGSGDTDIRRLLQQKLESLARDKANNRTPTQQELQTYLSENADRFRVDPTLTFHQIYFDNVGNAIGADAAARFLLGELRSQDMPDDTSDLGDPSSLPSYVENVMESEIRVLLGGEFSSALARAAMGEWIGPLSSDFGLHLVFVEDRVEGRLPVLDEIEENVRREWESEREAAAVNALYKQLLTDYRVTID